MTSQIGSWPRVARSALGNGRSVATGTVRSAMLTYLGQIVIRELAATKGSYPRLGVKRLRRRRKRALMGGPKHTGCRAATQKPKDEPASTGAGPTSRGGIAMAEQPN